VKRKDKFIYKFLCFILLLLLFSCSSEKPAEVGSQKPSEAGGGRVSDLSGPPASSVSAPYSLQIVPSNATRNSTIYLVAQGFNPSDAKIEWLVNGKVTTTPISSQFNALGTKKGDKVQAMITIQGKEIISNSVQIKNSLPEISYIKLLPEVFKPGDTLSVEASGSDIDGDKVTVSYEWNKNGEPAGNSNRLEVPLKRGDKISVKITPFDGEVYGRSVVLPKEILNLPPMINEDKTFHFDGKVYTYQVKATDQDGYLLAYSLKLAPQGMTINQSTGLIQWHVPPDFKGKSPITVSVTDGHGGEAIQSLTLEIAPEKK
jgi:uncharacterized lipoprotein YmbA